MSGPPTVAGRLVLITGGTSGIGAGLAAAYLAAGDRVVTCGRRADALAALGAAHAEAVAQARLILQVADVADATARAGLVEVVRRLSDHLDLLINNAGVILDSGTLEESVDAWRATLEVNLIAPFALSQACAPLLERATAPVIINLSSACARHPFDSCTSTSYSVSKAGLDMLTQRLAMALAPRGIRVNGVAPGVVATPMWGGSQGLMDTTVAHRHRLGQVAVTPQDVAAAVCFLASPEARLITGTTLPVDAGYALG